MPPAFPRLRWFALAWLAFWIPVYLWTWGWRNFLLLCDLAVLLTAAGLWRSNALLLSSQAVSTLVVGIAWSVDLVWRGLAGSHLMGGTEYFWDLRYPLWVRLVSFYHVGLPVLLVWAVRRIGYDRRGWKLQSALAAVVLVASRLIAPGWNLNYSEREPLLHRTWGPAPVHLAVVLAFLILICYWPAHRVLAAALPNRK